MSEQHAQLRDQPPGTKVVYLLLQNHEDRVTTAELATHELGLSEGGTRRALHRLARLGVVERVTAPDDGRRYLWLLCEDGDRV